MCAVCFLGDLAPGVKAAERGDAITMSGGDRPALASPDAEHGAERGEGLWMMEYGAIITAGRGEEQREVLEEGAVAHKGLKEGAIGMLGSTAIGIASTAPRTAWRQRLVSWS